VYGATASSPDDALDAELAVAGALEDLGFRTEIIEVALDFAAIETLPSRQPFLVFNLVDAIDCDSASRPLCRRGSMPLALPTRVAARAPYSKRCPRLGLN
jgi:hypothetical protein